MGSAIIGGVADKTDVINAYDIKKNENLKVHYKESIKTMIRKRLIEISDEAFLKITEPHNNAIDDYIETILYDYAAYYIAKGYELSALWESSLKSHVHSAINTFEGIKFIKDYDYEKLKLILLEKYSLIITDDNTLNIKKVTRV